MALRAGARTQASGLVTAALAVLVALFLAPVLSDLPQATLGAMVVVATLGLVDIGAFARFWRINKLEFAIALATALIGLTAGLLPAVAVGVLFTLYLVLRELNQPHVVQLRRGADGRWTGGDEDAPRSRPIRLCCGSIRPCTRRTCWPTSRRSGIASTPGARRRSCWTAHGRGSSPPP